MFISWNCVVSAVHYNGWGLAEHLELFNLLKNELLGQFNLIYGFLSKQIITFLQMYLTYMLELVNFIYIPSLVMHGLTV